MERSTKKISLLYIARERIKNTSEKSANIIHFYELQKLGQVIDGKRWGTTKKAIRDFLKKYWNLSKSELWEALYELIEIFRDIDECYEEEEKEAK